jgi:hypothetical protein
VTGCWIQSDAPSGRTNFSTLDPRQEAILSIFRDTVFGTRIHRYILHIVPYIANKIVSDVVPHIATNIVLDIVYDIVAELVLGIAYFVLLLAQDCVCTVAPYPFRMEPLEDLDPIGDFDVTGGGDVW